MFTRKYIAITNNKHHKIRYLSKGYNKSLRRIFPKVNL